MLYILGFVLVAVILIHSYRHYALHKPNKPIDQLPFEGDIYKLGDNVVGKRKLSGEPTKTVVCMPGFLETAAYYYDLYKDADVDLILVNNCFYHSPLDESKARRPAWFTSENPYESGTIEHDAFVMAQVLQHLPSTDNVILHGHSRGGAVVMETGRLLQSMPARERHHYAAVLEAPVLPQGKARGHDSPLLVRLAMRYFMPLMFHQFRDNAGKYLNFSGYKHPHTDIKQHLISQVFGNPKQLHITVTNINSIDQWAENTGYGTYDAFTDITVLVPVKDIVLDRDIMLQSATARPHVKVKEVENADHFISLERPEFVRQLVAELPAQEPVKPEQTESLVQP